MRDNFEGFGAFRCDDFQNCHTPKAIFRTFFRTFVAVMVTLPMMQFTAVVLMLLLTIKLLFLRERRIKSRLARQARWLMAGGTALMVVHFAIQLKTGLRLHRPHCAAAHLQED